MDRNGTKSNPNQVVERSILNFKFFFMYCFLSFSSIGQSEELVDRLIAEVNGSAITWSEQQTKVQKGPLIEVSPFPSLESDPQNEIALNDLINKALVLQRAEELEIEVSDSALDEEIKGFLTRRSLSREALDAALAQQGMSYEQYREDFRTQMTINQFEGRELLPQVKITDRDVQLYYLKHSGNLAENIKLTLRQLSISVPSASASSVKEGKKALSDRAYQELESGMPFEQAVKIYSDDEAARENGGIMSQIYLRDLAPQYQSVVKDLEEGKYSHPLETPNGYVIFYVEKKEFTGSDEYKKSKPQLEASLRQEEMGRLLARWLDSQRQRSDIKVKKAIGPEISK